MTSVQQRDDAIEPTINAAVFRQLRADIVACRLAPNERLRVEALRGRYGVGGSPIREALMRLEAEGLVTLEQNKGFRVSPVSKEHLTDLMKTRIEIECVALRWSIEKGGVTWEANLVAAFNRLVHLKKVERSTGVNVNSDWVKEHRNFHTALVAGCGSPRLMAIRDNLFAQAERYFALSIVSKVSARNDKSEHEQIMRAALARNAPRATQLLADHIDRTTERVAKFLSGTERKLKLRTSNGKDV
jgi:GntR family transcriptional regulator, carbon starvation induced regulator